MRKLAKILTAIAMALLIFLLIAFYGVTLRVEVIGFSPQSARTNPTLTQELVESARRNDMLSNRFRIPTRDSLDSYQLIFIELRVRNIGLLPAEWVQIRLSPDPMDVALFPNSEGDVPGFGSSREISATLLAEAEAPSASRAMWIDYYVFGRKFEVPIALQ